MRVGGQRRALGLTAFGLWVLAAVGLGVQIAVWAGEGDGFCGRDVTGQPLGTAHFSMLPPAPRCAYPMGADRGLQPLYGLEWGILAVLLVWLAVALLVLRWYPRRRPTALAGRLQTPVRSGR